MSGFLVFLIIAAFAVFAIIAIIFLVRAWLFGRYLVKNFRRCNVVVDGKKGKGKDLLFQYVIDKRKAPYYSNIDYGGAYTPIKMKDVSVSPNTYQNFLEDRVEVVKRQFVERKDIYLSDGGIYMPSFMDSQLYKLYPSLPLYYPLSRHSAEHNIHVNVQNLPRLWKALREQADFFVHVKTNIKLPFFIFVKCNAYDNIDSAMRTLEPIRGRLLNKYSKAEVDLFHAEHGEIRGGWIILRKSRIKYDTRALEKVLYGEQPRIVEEGTD